MGSRLTTTPQALWLFQPTPAQRVANARPFFNEGIACGLGVTGGDIGDFSLYADQNKTYARIFAVSWQGNGEAAGTFDVISHNDATEPAVVQGHYRSVDGSNGITVDVPVGANIAHFKNGVLVGIT